MMNSPEHPMPTILIFCIRLLILECSSPCMVYKKQMPGIKHIQTRIKISVEKFYIVFFNLFRIWGEQAGFKHTSVFICLVKTIYTQKVINLTRIPVHSRYFNGSGYKRITIFRTFQDLDLDTFQHQEIKKLTFAVIIYLYEAVNHDSQSYNKDTQTS